MKLRKEEFEEVLMEAAHHTANIRGGRCVEIHDAFIHNNLEIEGYDRSGWTKFDPNDPKTFPPKNTVVLVMICKALSDGAPKKMSVEVFNEYHMPNWLGGTFTHWRPLPNPPGKEEA